MMTCVQIVLPDQLAEQAREAGLLERQRSRSCCEPSCGGELLSS